MSPQIIIPDQQGLENKINSFIRAGANRLHVLADFDRTLTFCFKDGQRSPTLIHLLMKRRYLTPDYPAKAQALFDYYRPIEIDPTVSKERLKQEMAQWWRRHFDLLVESGLTRQDVERVISDSGVSLRSGIDEFLDTLRQAAIPLVIFSASGLGGESIELFLKQRQRFSSNIHLIANSFSWDEDGGIRAVNDPVIHSANKDETMIHDFPCYQEIADRRFVILLGDSLGDIGMVSGFDYEGLIKVGFLNEKVEENLAAYQAAFDVVILNDGPLDYVNNLLAKILVKQ